MSDVNKQTNEELPMEDFEALIEESLQQPSKGSVVTGVVAQITDSDVLINIGYKSEGVAPRAEFEENGELTVKIGDEVEIMIVNVSGGGGMVRLSKKILSEASDWEDIKTAFEAGSPVDVKIVAKRDKGYAAKIGEIEAFVPDTHIDFKNQVKNVDTYIGQTFKAKILKLGSHKRSALVSPKLCMIEEQNGLKKDFFETTKVGDRLKGEVKTLMNYGVFINFGPVDGFLHKNNIGWGHVKHPSKYLAEGDTVEVVVLDINLDDQKIEVGLKQINEDPWAAVATKYPEDTTVKGTVVTRKRAGYVIEIEPGVDGFVPNEELSWLKNARLKLEQGDMIEGRVIGVDNDNKKVRLSIKNMNENPWSSIMKKHPEGSLVKGTVKNVTDFGVFVDFGEFIDGLIRKGDVSWTEEIEDLNALYKAGDVIEAKVLRIDAERERISLGIKQLETNPWKEASKLFPFGKQVEVPVVAINSDGLTVELTKGLNGTIPTEELAETKAASAYTVGEIVKAVVVRSDARQKQVVLSVTKFLKDTERREVKEYMKQMEDTGDNGFGTIMKDLFRGN